MRFQTLFMQFLFSTPNSILLAWCLLACNEKNWLKSSFLNWFGLNLAWMFQIAFLLACLLACKEKKEESKFFMGFFSNNDSRLCWYGSFHSFASLHKVVRLSIRPFKTCSLNRRYTWLLTEMLRVRGHGMVSDGPARLCLFIFNVRLILGRGMNMNSSLENAVVCL